MIFALGLGFAKNGITLAVFWGLQGMGAAAAIPFVLCLGILAHSFPPLRARSVAFVTFAVSAPIGGAFGIMIGGVLTQLSKEHWRAPFFLAAGLSILCVLGALTSFDPDNISPEADRRVDWIGAMLVISGLVLTVFVLGQGPIAGWKTLHILIHDMITCLVIGVILVGIFLAWEFHLENSITGPEQPKIVLDATTSHETINMGTSQGPDGRNTSNRVPKLVWFDLLDVLGSVVLPELPWAYARVRDDPTYTHACHGLYL
ncbi:hypothetical protein J3R83DRAFT_5051 [Lanmaoa asiatica]|nr:hypothetical protein J3R83DRAFT_5051 [Lanmaoa asiatica]